MTFTEYVYSRPKSVILLGKTHQKINLIVHGQGVFLFENEENNHFCVFEICDKEEKKGLKIDITETSVQINRLPTLEPLVDKNNKQGLTSK